MAMAMALQVSSFRKDDQHSLKTFALAPSSPPVAPETSSQSPEYQARRDSVLKHMPPPRPRDHESVAITHAMPGALPAMAALPGASGLGETLPAGAIQGSAASRDADIAPLSVPLLASSHTETDAYSVQVHGWLEHHKSYPREFARSGAQGVVTLGFELDRRGRLRLIRVVSSSGMRWMDRLAQAQLRAAEPFPPAPTDATWRTREFVVPMRYRPQA
ncbi:TonB family protein [Sphingobium aquiterrae]|uniref:energy transducer TonB n=1 Tax=Sphingobium aquiterrae TaxID=2038656 RepID=UPI00301AD579